LKVQVLIIAGKGDQPNTRRPILVLYMNLSKKNSLPFWFGVVPSS